MLGDRLCQVDMHLELLREQQVALEREALYTTGLHKVQAEQRLRTEIKPKIREYEREYWQLLAERSEASEIVEPVPEVVVAEILAQVGQLQTNPQYSDEMLIWLRKIYVEVNKPGVPAAAKLKGTISLMPPFVNLSYEAELDTENFLRAHFPTFTKWCKALAKKP